jgi:hypothetical protein
MRVSRHKLALLALFAVTGSMTLLSQNHASFQMIQSSSDGLPINDLILPDSNSAYGAWSLTLQLLTADMIKDPQAVTKALERAMSHVSLPHSRPFPLYSSPTQADPPLDFKLPFLQTVSTHGLLLLGLSAIDPSRSTSRGLKRATFSKRTDSHLLIGSAVDDDDDNQDEFDFDVEAVNGVDTTDDTTSLFMRAIIASSQPSSDSVAALVHLAKSGEIFSWSQELKTAGLPVAGIEVVSLAPHAPNSVEAKLQAQLLILHEEMNEVDSFDETHPAFATAVTAAGNGLDNMETSFSSTTLSAFSSNFTGGIVSLALATVLVACLAIVAMVQAKRSAATAAAVAASETFIRNNAVQNNESDALGTYSKLHSSASYC